MTSRSMDFWTNHVRSNYEEYKRNRTDIRRAMNAALSAFHMADYVLKEYRASDPSKLSGYRQLGEYRDHVLEVECSDFALLADVANAHKHLWLGPHTASGQFTRSATEVVIDVATIFTKDAAGHPVDFGPVLDNVMAMWERLIAKDGL